MNDDECLFSLLPALARRRFRLASKCLSFSLVRDGRECVGVSVQGVAKRNGGGLVGMVCLVGSFAKETIGVAWFFRERTPLGVQGSAGKDGTVECRRPLGLRADGCGRLLMRGVLLLFVNMLRTGMRQGLQRKWPAVCGVSKSPLAPLKGGDQQVQWPVPAGHCSGKPDGAAAQDGMTCVIVGANDYSPLQNGCNATPPRRGAQIKKLMMCEFYENWACEI